MPIFFRSSHKKLRARVAYLEQAANNYGEHLRALNAAVALLNDQVAVLENAKADADSDTAAALYARHGKVQRTIYQSDFDVKRFDNLKTTTYIDSGIEVDDVLNDVNSNVYHQMNCADTELKDGQIYAESLTDYHRLLSDIASDRNVRFVTALELSDLDPNDSQVVCHIRHDVDADIAVCIPMAEIEASLGIRSTYYLLHTAAYYGQWQDQGETTRFARNESMAVIYLKLQALGHEVALHTDPHLIYQDHLSDGARALVEEINWLRSIGLSISGTAPHNAPAVYGASNSALFEGRDIDWDIESGPSGVINGEKWSALGVLSETELSLHYEANDIFSSEHAIDTDFISMTSKDKWYRNYHPLELKGHGEPSAQGSGVQVIGSDSKYGRIYQSDDDFWIKSSEVPKAVKEAGPKIAVLSIHPEYYGWRASPSETPQFNPQNDDIDAKR